MQQTSKATGLSFLCGRKKLLIQPAQIIRLEASSNYTRVYFTNHPPLLMAKVLHAYDQILHPFGFVRTHRSHLINPLFVKGFSPNGTIHMRDSSIIEISRRKKPQVLKMISNLISKY